MFSAAQIENVTVNTGLMDGAEQVRELFGFRRCIACLEDVHNPIIAEQLIHSEPCLIVIANFRVDHCREMVGNVRFPQGWLEARATGALPNGVTVGAQPRRTEYRVVSIAPADLQIAIFVEGQMLRRDIGRNLLNRERADPVGTVATLRTEAIVPQPDVMELADMTIRPADRHPVIGLLQSLDGDLVLGHATGDRRMIAFKGVGFFDVFDGR